MRLATKHGEEDPDTQRIRLDFSCVESHGADYRTGADLVTFRKVAFAAGHFPRLADEPRVALRSISGASTAARSSSVSSHSQPSGELLSVDLFKYGKHPALLTLGYDIQPRTR